MVVTRLALLALALLLAAPADAQPTGAPVIVLAAGSLMGALGEIGRTFTQQTGIPVTLTYGPSGLLRTQIEQGTHFDVFASADTGNPQRLQSEGRGGGVSVFTHNHMCLLVKSALTARGSVVAIMLDPAVRLITSTPQADPAGDYAEEIFTRIETSRPGAHTALDAKALRLVGGPNAVKVPADADLGAYLVLTANLGDAFLAYCSGFITSVAQNPGKLQSLTMPPDLDVRADYGLTLSIGASPAAARLRDFILSDQGQAILQKYGFART